MDFGNVKSVAHLSVLSKIAEKGRILFSSMERIPNAWNPQPHQNSLYLGGNRSPAVRKTHSFSYSGKIGLGDPANSGSCEGQCVQTGNFVIVIINYQNNYTGSFCISVREAAYQTPQNCTCKYPPLPTKQIQHSSI